jgi:hypothetical protein
VRFIDDVVPGKLAAKRSRGEQVEIGLRLGISAGAFLVAAMLLGNGLPRVVSSGPPYHLIWSDWVSWIEVSLACLLLYATAGIWVLLVGGIAFFGVGKSILMLVTGSEPYHGQHVPRLEAAEGLFFCLATLLLIFRFWETRPSILDRVTLTFYVFVIAWYGQSSVSTSVDLRVAAGLIALVISWCVYRWKETKPQRKATKPRSPEGQLLG